MTNADVATRTEKFSDPDWTADGQPRARVPLKQLTTLWINTGTLCNIACRNCYIESSPTNDTFVYISRTEVAAFLEEIAHDGWPVREIGFTGGEPFMNPDMIDTLTDELERDLSALVLTNAMQPMMRPRIREGLLALRRNHGDRLQLRVSLDHYTRALHDEERGPGSFDKTLEGIDWLTENGFALTLAGRTCWGESEGDARGGYADLIYSRSWPVSADQPDSLVLFPEMDPEEDVPEITDACWGVLNVSPSEMMCASSRMVVKRKGDDAPVVLPCTLLTDLARFEMGTTLAEAATAHTDFFDQGTVKLCHPHCARFCVLGGGSCSKLAIE